MIQPLDLPQMDAGTFAFTAGLGRQWSAILVETPAVAPHAAQELLNALDLEGDLQAIVLETHNGQDFVQQLVDHPHNALIVIGLDTFEDEDWHIIDQARSRILESPLVVLVLTEVGFVRMDREAPNLTSLLDANVSTWEDVAAQLRNQRLNALRMSTGFSDEDVICMAGAGEIPSGPEFAEWLMLLGRGDLLGT